MAEAREPSEWPRSTDAEEHRRRRQMSGTATGNDNEKLKICGCGGIGRLIGFRFQRESVQVRVLSSAPKYSNPNLLPIGETFGFVVFIKDRGVLITLR